MGDRMHGFPVSVLDGNSTDTWVSASVDIGRVSRVRVVFRGVVGSGYDGDIAIDDVAFHNCKCKNDCSLNLIDDSRTLSRLTLCPRSNSSRTLHYYLFRSFYQKY